MRRLRAEEDERTMTDYDERLCLCALNRILGFRPDLAHGILEHLGSAAELFRLGDEGRKELFGPWSRLVSQINDRELETTEDELRRLERQGCSFVTRGDPGFPKLLLDCPDSPLGLYFKGCGTAEDVFNIRPQIAVVGTRDISLYGKDWCEKIVSAMSRAGTKPLIVSGLAIGTDIIAHSAALDAGLPTVAVLPTGIDSIYPGRNRKHASRILSTPGSAVITDYPPGTTPKAINFIRRNRIIAGICSATILIESRLKGGGMITARLAASYDRELLVLPGRADDTRSAGCNALLREKAAEPVTDAESFIRTLGLGSPGRLRLKGLEERVRQAFGELIPDDELAMMLSLAGSIAKKRGISLDELCAAAGLGYARVSALTALLESEGIISIDLLQRCTVRNRVM